VSVCVCVCVCGFEFSGIALISGPLLLCPAFTMPSDVPGAKIRQKKRQEVQSRNAPFQFDADTGTFPALQ